MYNEEYKNAYIDSLDVSQASRNQYMAMFRHTGEIEEKLNKDLYDMTFDELELTFYKPKYKKANTLINYINKIKSYISWAKANGFSSDRDNPIVVSISEEFVSKYILNTGSTYFTREEILEGIKNLVNAQHRAIVLCFFEGIRGDSYSEIINMKNEDLSEREGKYFVNVMPNEIDNDPREVEISKELYDLLKEVYSTQEFISPTERKIRILDGEYIFRRNETSRDKSDVRINAVAIGNIINSFIKPAFGNRNINSNYIYNSGMMYKINQMMDSNRVFDKNIADKIIEEYNLSTLQVNNKTYPAYSSLRRVIDEDFIKEAYGDFELKI